MGRMKELAMYREAEGRYLNAATEGDAIEEQMRWYLQHPDRATPQAKQPAKATTQKPPRGK